MRNISFALTTPQFRARTKTVMRRAGWRDLKPGTLLMGVVRSQWIRPGEAIERLGVIRVLSVRREPLDAITREDCIAEGFPLYSPNDFTAMFRNHKGRDTDEVTRIEFEYVDGEGE